MGFSFSSSPGRLHSSIYTLHPGVDYSVQQNSANKPQATRWVQRTPCAAIKRPQLRG
jgi:hypothetical protein